MKITEKQIENYILEYLNFHNGFKCYKNNNVPVFEKNSGKFRLSHNPFMPKGASDIYGSYKGRAVFIEIKTPEELKYLLKHYNEIKNHIDIGPKKNAKKNHLKNQIKYIEDNRNNGCIAFFADSIECVKAEFEKFGVVGVFK